MKLGSSDNGYNTVGTRIVFLFVVALMVFLLARVDNGINSILTTNNDTKISIDPSLEDLVSAGKGSDRLVSGIQKLKNHPACKIIYFAEYLPVISESVITRCERVLVCDQEQHLKNEYIEQICANPEPGELARVKIAEVQYRLKDYSLVFPQSGIQLVENDVDGVYGPDTCHAVANYQYETQYGIVNGVPDEFIYKKLALAIPIKDAELKRIAAEFSKPVKPVSSPGREVVAEFHPVERAMKLPRNPLKQIVFCFQNPSFTACNEQQGSFHVAGLDSFK